MVIDIIGIINITDSNLTLDQTLFPTKGNPPNAVLFSLGTFTSCLVNASVVLPGKSSSDNWSVLVIKKRLEGRAVIKL